MKSAPESAGGVTSTPPPARLVRSAAVNAPPSPEPVTVAVVPSAESVTVRPLSVPAATTAPSGIPAMVTEVTASEPSTSTFTVVMARPTVVSSSVDAADTDKSGASATAATATVKLSDVVAVSPSFSVDVTFNVIDISPLKSSGGRMQTSGSSLGVTVHDPSPLSVPGFKRAPSGTSVIVMLRLSEPSVSFSAESR